MNLTNITNSMTRSFNKLGIQLKKHSPEILVVAGVVGTVTSAVMACKATTKINDVLDESKVDLEKIHSAAERLENGEELLCNDGSKYTEEQNKKDLAIAYTQSAIKVAKLYAPSVIIGALSITAILSSNNILRKRNVALAAAYTAVDKSFKEYRGRVVERFGKEMDRELRYNIKAKEFEETVTDEKTGKEKKVKKTVEVVGVDGYSDYSKFFDEGCAGWSKDPEQNLFFLKRQQDYANEVLKAKGYLFLNDVYEMLGIPRTKAGQVVGWIYDEKNPVGDNVVDFGIYDGHRKTNRDFVNGYERTILLDFNVDGNILDLI